MAQDNAVFTQPLGDDNYRDLQVYYDKGGINYWTYEQKPKGIYFAVHRYKRSGGMTSWSTGQQGDGYMLITPLERYSPKALRLVRERVEQNAILICQLLSGGDAHLVRELLEGKMSEAAIRGYEHAYAASTSEAA